MRQRSGTDVFPAGRPEAVFAFSPEHSGRFPWTTSYPLLIGSAVYWAAEDPLDSSRGMNRRTGELLKTPGKQITWQVPGTEKPIHRSVYCSGDGRARMSRF